MHKFLHLGLNAAKNKHIKKSSNKCSELNFVQKKVHERICLPPLRVELGGSKDTHLRNIPMWKNGKVYSLWGLTLLKIRTESKNGSYMTGVKVSYLRKL